MEGGFTSVVQIGVLVFRLLPVFDHMTLKIKNMLSEHHKHDVNILTTTTHTLPHTSDL